MTQRRAVCESTGAGRLDCGPAGKLMRAVARKLARNQRIAVTTPASSRPAESSAQRVFTTAAASET
jgi:hypothetical protein